MVEQAETYQNPVFPESFPDPFVLKFCGEYFAYCTGFAKDGLAVGVAHSLDLINWNYIGGALQPIASEPPYYWAPEVVYHNGRFYMYYSCGNETLMEIRVAVSDRPDRNFIDAGHRLTSEEFAIDAHVFTDDDGQRYLFYATDFLTHTHIGTGTVVDRMISWFELEGSPKPVSRAAYDWQVYDPHRIEKGGVRWHTVEGPTVFKYKRKYFEMFSGGNWQNSSYGVGYATSDTIERPDEWDQSIDGSSVLPILRTIPEKVIGPGHNSAAVGPNGRELYCVYHRWEGVDRVMAIDRMGFAGHRLFVNGPTFARQIAPHRPTYTSASAAFEFTGDWERSENSISNLTTSAMAEIPAGSTCFLTELSFRIGEPHFADSAITFGGRFGELPVFTLKFVPATGTVTFADRQTRELRLGEPIDFSAFQHLSVDGDGHFVRIRLNGLSLELNAGLEFACDRFFIETENARTEVRGFALTRGFEDLFDREGDALTELGWNKIGPVEAQVADGELRFSTSGSEEGVIWRGEPARSFDLAANIRSTDIERSEAGFGFALLDENATVVRKFVIGRVDGQAVISDTLNGVSLPLPSSFQGESHRQFRFLKLGSRLRIESEECLLGEFEMDSNPAIVGIFTKGAEVATEMVRWTPLADPKSE